MPAPATYEYSVAALVGAHQFFADLLDAGTGNGKIRCLDDDDEILAEIPLSASNVVNGTTGQLTITATGPDLSADATDDCTYVQLVDGDGLVHLAIPAEAGTSPVSGKAVINALAIVAGAEVTLITCTLG